MADTERNQDPDTTQPQGSETRETEHDRVRATNDTDQELEREGITSKRNRGYDEAARGEARTSTEDVDPDSAEAENDRDDTIDEP